MFHLVDHLPLYADSGRNISDIDQQLVQLFEYAKKHNVQGIKQLQDKIEQIDSSTLTQAYYLALYIADPAKFESQYVDKFPTNSQGIAELYSNIELKKLTPSFLYFVTAIGDIALRGNEKAIEKVFLADSNADGVVGEFFCEYSGKIIIDNPQNSLIVLARMELFQRREVYKCFQLMVTSDLSRLKKQINTYKTQDKIILQVKKEIMKELEP